MKPDKKRPSIREEDVDATTIERRTFLGRFGVAAGLASLAGWTTACGESSTVSDVADTDGDPADADPTDAADTDGDPADSD